MKKIAIHQPNFLPWMGFFEKARQVDQFVLLDHVAFSKGSFTNRVKYFCKSSQQVKWLTVPLQQAPLGTPINKMLLAPSTDWKKKMVRTLEQNINNAFIPIIVDTIVNHRTEKLSDFNITLIKQLFRILDIKTPLIRSSALSLEEDKQQQVVLNICQLVQADSYVCGQGALNYINAEAFAQKGIQLNIRDFKKDIIEAGLVDMDTAGLSALCHM